MRNPKGYAFQTDRETGLIVSEADTFTCSHCHRIVHVKPMCDPADMGGHCRVCDGLICKSCNYLMSLGKPCMPFVERVNRLEKRLARGEPWIDPMRVDDGH